MHDALCEHFALLPHDPLKVPISVSIVENYREGSVTRQLQLPVKPLHLHLLGAELRSIIVQPDLPDGNHPLAALGQLKEGLEVCLGVAALCKLCAPGGVDADGGVDAWDLRRYRDGVLRVRKRSRDACEV